jgi:hypothetical protein
MSDPDSSPVVPTPTEPHAVASEHRRLWRETTAMMLYVSIVLVAELAVLPAGRDHASEPVHGPVGWELVAIIWGTTIGLALAHYFAFQVATQGVGRARLRGQDLEEALGEVGGAAFIAALATIPVVVFPTDIEQEMVLIVLAFTVGVVGFLVERAGGRSRLTAFAFGAATLLVGLAIAVVKNVLAGH